jgi:ornithine--oxo-acid transaminase
MGTEGPSWLELRLEENRGRQYEMHTRHINPSFVKMLRTIDFDRGYVHGQGCYLWDAEGNKYLDLLTGWGVFALGRKHLRVKAVLR